MFPHSLKSCLDGVRVNLGICDGMKTTAKVKMKIYVFSVLPLHLTGEMYTEPRMSLWFGEFPYTYSRVSWNLNKEVQKNVFLFFYYLQGEEGGLVLQCYQLYPVSRIALLDRFALLKGGNNLPFLLPCLVSVE